MGMGGMGNEGAPSTTPLAARFVAMGNHERRCVSVTLPGMVPLRLVLMRPQNPDNVGAIARTMKNFGVREWVFVAPEFGDLNAAKRMAVHAEELLGQARIVGTLDEAVHDCVWVVGTSSRHVRGKRRLGPRETA